MTTQPNITPARAALINAWGDARIAARKFGGSARQYIAAALRDAWAALKVNGYAIAAASIILAMRAERAAPRNAKLPSVGFLAAVIRHKTRLGRSYSHAL